MIEPILLFNTKKNKQVDQMMIIIIIVILPTTHKPPCFDNDCMPYGMNRSFKLPSLGNFQSRFFNMLPLSGEVRIS